eukprot:186119-Alexandrium_andersonii.AAC.1
MGHARGERRAPGNPRRPTRPRGGGPPHRAQHSREGAQRTRPQRDAWPSWPRPADAARATRRPNRTPAQGVKPKAASGKPLATDGSLADASKGK